MQDRMKMRSVSFSDEAPPAIPPRTFPPPRATRRQTSAESLPLYENSEMNNESSALTKNLRLNSLPRMIPHHRRKILDFNRPSSSLAGHYQYLGDPLPDYANLTNISRRGTFYNQRQNSLKQGWLTFHPPLWKLVPSLSWRIYIEYMHYKMHCTITWKFLKLLF